MGEGPDGALRPYTPGYSSSRARAGLNSSIDLQVTGAFLRDMKVIRISDVSATIGWAGTSSQDQYLGTSGMRSAGSSTAHTEIVKRLQANGRQILGLNKAQRDIIRTWIKTWFKKHAKSS